MIGIVSAALLEAVALAIVLMTLPIIVRRETRRITNADTDQERKDERLELLLVLGGAVATTVSTLTIPLFDLVFGVLVFGDIGVLLPELLRTIGFAETAIRVSGLPGFACLAVVYVIVTRARHRVRGLTALPPGRMLARLMGKFCLGGLVVAVVTGAVLAARRSAMTLAVGAVCLPIIVMGAEIFKPVVLAWWCRYTPADASVTALIDDAGSDVRILVSPSMNDEKPTAVAHGWGRTETIVVNAGAIAEFGENALAGLLYHELAHHERGDQIIRIAGDAAVVTLPYLAGSVLWMYLGYGLIATGAIVLLLIVLALGLFYRRLRVGEFAADRRAVEATGDPEAVKQYLRQYRKIRSERRSGGILPNLRVRLRSKWLATHPTPQERIDSVNEFVNDEGESTSP